MYIYTEFNYEKNLMPGVGVQDCKTSTLELKQDYFQFKTSADYIARTYLQQEGERKNNSFNYEKWGELNLLAVIM